MTYSASMTIDYSTQTTLITGASAGIGVAIARQLAARGSDLVLVARRADRLEALAAELAAEHGITATAVPFDLGIPAAGRALAAELEARGITITSLVNNAGFGTWGEFTNENPDQLEQMIALNITALVDLTLAFIAPLKLNGTGILVNVASLAAYQPSPRMAVYAATKAFVLSFTEALWYESRDSGLRVLCLSPGATSSEFFEVVGTDEASGGSSMQTPEQVATTMVRTLDRRRSVPSVASGAQNAAIAAIVKLIPRRATVVAMGRLTGRRP